MVTNRCPACGQPIRVGDINVGEGVGLCRSCGKLSRLRDIADQPVVDDARLAPPAGCSYHEPVGGGLVVRVSMRSPGTAVRTLAVCLFCNGIVSVFLLFAIGALYTNLVGPLPRWFPAPFAGGGKGGSGTAPGLGETLFLCVFLTPFILIGRALFLVFLTSLLGRIDVILTGTDGRVRSGLGPFRWARRFDASRVTRVVEGRTGYAVNGEHRPLIRIDADRTVKFGSMLPDERRKWLLDVLYLLLVVRDPKAQTALGSSRFGQSLTLPPAVAAR